ncbi:FecR domain-containing protein [Spirochaetota bacterium]
MKTRIAFTFILLVTIPVMFVSGCKKDKGQVDLSKAHGFISFFSGKVEITDNKNQTKSASVKAPLIKGYKIKTYKRSFATVQIGSNIVLKVLANTELLFESLLENEETQLKLNKGSVYTKVLKKLKKEEKFDIGTPTTVAAIRGTEFLTEYKKGSSNIFVKTGKIAVFKSTKQLKKDDKPVAFVEAGNFIVVDKMEKVKLLKTTPIRKLELEKLSRGTKNIPKIKEMKIKEIKIIEKKMKKEVRSIDRILDRKIQNIKNVDNPVVILELKDGSKLKGHVMDQNEKTIKLDDGKDIMSIPKSDIVRREFKK